MEVDSKDRTYPLLWNLRDTIPCCSQYQWRIREEENIRQTNEEHVEPFHRSE